MPPTSPLQSSMMLKKMLLLLAMACGVAMADNNCNNNNGVDANFNEMALYSLGALVKVGESTCC